jgi:hypothetical protein
MKAHDGQFLCPKVGTESCCLGVRPKEIDVDPDGMTEPGRRKGMSVSPSIDAIPPLLVPPQYANIVEGPGGKKSHRVWTMGQGEFMDGPFAAGLRLCCTSHRHGVAEPECRMHHEEYAQALANTQTDWRVIEPK